MEGRGRPTYSCRYRPVSSSSKRWEKKYKAEAKTAQQHLDHIDRLTATHQQHNDELNQLHAQQREAEAVQARVEREWRDDKGRHCSIDSLAPAARPKRATAGWRYEKEQRAEDGRRWEAARAAWRAEREESWR